MMALLPSRAAARPASGWRRDGREMPWPRRRPSSTPIVLHDLLELNGEDTDEDGATVFRHVCKLGLKGFVSKRLGAPCRSGRGLDQQPGNGTTLRMPMVRSGSTINRSQADAEDNGQALAYIYSRDNEAEALQAKVLTKDEARRVAVNIARLPGLLGKADHD
jgi:hypothetical protein